jgi:hypothetical protein
VQISYNICVGQHTEEKKMIVEVRNIQWDTDGEDLDLPRTMRVKLDPGDQENWEDLVSDEISDQTGFCHFGFEAEIVEQ